MHKPAAHEESLGRNCVGFKKENSPLYITALQLLEPQTLANILTLTSGWPSVSKHNVVNFLLKKSPVRNNSELFSKCATVDRPKVTF